ncbi:MAG: DAK2 domain-containing protein [Gordonia sp. (in: high G+C Gram-positive bacteria)]|uniref:DAK2 domain-containing protein n=1 Tax=Gordonia sp. (in: high G+C Gram-positive bacteria) TaxID=84139 RepID=UPI0039E3E5E6
MEASGARPDAAQSSGASAPVSPGLIRDWAHACARGLAEQRGEINDLNVFPIPDADTGSNMAFTMAGAAEALDALPDDAALPLVTRTLADAAVANARGNSGIILSQILVGLADAADLAAADDDLGFNRLAANGLRLASLSAQRAVSIPREGTVLTVLRVAADTAAREVGGSPADMVRATADEAAVALEATTEQMIELANAGVVDAGARGFLVMLDAMVFVVTGVANRRRTYRGSMTDTGHLGGECSGSGDTAFEVMYLLVADGTRIGALREELGELGDSVVIVGDSSTAAEQFSVHVHTDVPGEAVEAGLRLGEVRDIRISCFLLDEARRNPGANEPPPRHRRAVLVLAQGDGAEQLFADAGASVVRTDAGIDPATVAAAIVAADSAHTVVMGNGQIASADLVSVGADARSAKRSLVFIPTLSMVQCLAALAVHEPAESPDVDAFAMAEAAAATRWGSLQRSTTKMMTLVGTCEVGDTLGLIGSDVLVIAGGHGEAATRLIDLMLGTGGELVTILVGRDLDDAARTRIEEHVHREHPGIELAMYDAGHTGQLLQIGVE